MYDIHQTLHSTERKAFKKQTFLMQEAHFSSKAPQRQIKPTPRNRKIPKRKHQIDNHHRKRERDCPKRTSDKTN
jgi:hypothetical protein